MKATVAYAVIESGPSANVVLSRWLSGMWGFGVGGSSFDRVSTRSHRFFDLLLSRCQWIVRHMHRPLRDLDLADSGQGCHGVGHFLFIGGDTDFLDLDASDHRFTQRSGFLTFFFVHRS